MVTVAVRRCEDGAKPKGKALDLPPSPSSLVMTFGSVQKKQDRKDKNGFPPQGTALRSSGLTLTDGLMSLVQPPLLRIERGQLTPHQEEAPETQDT